jgi:hypothetical protein
LSVLPAEILQQILESVGLHQSQELLVKCWPQSRSMTRKAWSKWHALPRDTMLS